jgi:hypothetical protein
MQGLLAQDIQNNGYMGHELHAHISRNHPEMSTSTFCALVLLLLSPHAGLMQSTQICIAEPTTTTTSCCRI